MKKGQTGRLTGNAKPAAALQKQRDGILIQIGFQHPVTDAISEDGRKGKYFTDINMVDMNYQKLGKSLMSMDELAVMDGGKCILQVRGVRPFLSDKYDITAHPNYKYLSDFNPQNAFHIEKYLHRQLKIRLEEECEAFEVNVGDDEEPLEDLTDETQQMAAGYGGLL